MMFIKKNVIWFSVAFIITLVSTNSYAGNEQVVMKGTFNSSNLKAGYIVANDMKFSVDHLTRVYDTNGQLKSFKSLKPGQGLKMHYRGYGGQVKNVTDMILDKIIYSSR